MAIINRTDWRTIVRRTKQGKLLPIISDQVTSQLLFDSWQRIQAWSDDIGYPLGSSLSITRLAQYLSIQGDDLAAKEEFLAFSKRHLLNLALQNDSGDGELSGLKGKLDGLRLAELAEQLIGSVLQDETTNPLRRLAQLPISVYITTSYHNFLERSLQSLGKRPRIEICYWDHTLKASPASKLGLNPLARVRDILIQNFSVEELHDIAFQLDIDFSDLPGDGRTAKARALAEYLNRHNRLPDLVSLGRELRPNIAWAGILGQVDEDFGYSTAIPGLPSVFEIDPTYEPNADEPLIYHLLGLDAFPASMVLTEDDYLDFLVTVSADRRVVPPRINQALSDSSLLLLGYQLQDWDFRVLFRGLVTRKRSDLRRLSVAIQLAQATDETGHATEIASSQNYLERYFDKANFKIYWGDPQEFIHDLWDQWEEEL